MSRQQIKSLQWAFSKSSSFNHCPRSFYYYRENHLEKNETEHNNSEPINTLIGTVVHNTISKIIDKWVNREQIDLKQSQAEAEAWLNYVWENSGTLIIEAINGQQLNPLILSHQVSSSKEIIHKFLFAVLPRFRNHKYIMHEKLCAFPLDKYKILVKLDLATYDQFGRIIITDWKTGQTPLFQNTSLQMNVYAIWAMREFKVSAKNIIVQLVNLKKGEILKSKPLSKGLTKTKNLIKQECKKMSKSSIKNFPPLPSQNKCISCRFFNICDSKFVPIT